MSEQTLLHEDITAFDMDTLSSVDTIKALGKVLEENAYIDKSYIDSVVEREENFPTGLVLANAGIAIPHASPNNNVLKNGIAAARLKYPVEFACMEDPDKKVAVNMVFMLALARSTEHLEILKKLFIAFQNEDLVNNLLNSKNKIEFLTLLVNNLK